MTHYFTELLTSEASAPQDEVAAGIMRRMATVGEASINVGGVQGGSELRAADDPTTSRLFRTPEIGPKKIVEAVVAQAPGESVVTTAPSSGAEAARRIADSVYAEQAQAQARRFQAPAQAIIRVAEQTPQVGVVPQAEPLQPVSPEPARLRRSLAGRLIEPAKRLAGVLSIEQRQREVYDPVAKGRQQRIEAAAAAVREALTPKAVMGLGSLASEGAEIISPPPATAQEARTFDRRGTLLGLIAGGMAVLGEVIGRQAVVSSPPAGRVM